MGVGPLVAAAGLALMLRLDARRGLLDRPASRRCSCSRSGSRSTVAPLTATVLADADEHNAGIASAVNNAIARVAGLIAIAAIGARGRGQYASRLDDALGRAGLAAGGGRR